LSGGNRKRSATDGGKSNWRYNRPLGFGRTQRLSTWDISNVNGPRRQKSICRHYIKSRKKWMKV